MTTRKFEKLDELSNLFDLMASQVADTRFMACQAADTRFFEDLREAWIHVCCDDFIKARDAIQAAVKRYATETSCDRAFEIYRMAEHIYRKIILIEAEFGRGR